MAASTNTTASCDHQLPGRGACRSAAFFPSVDIAQRFELLLAELLLPLVDLLLLQLVIRMVNGELINGFPQATISSGFSESPETSVETHICTR